MPNIVDKMERLHQEPKPNPTFEDALTHMFLPKQIPGQQQPDLKKVENVLQRIFTTCIKTILRESPIPHLEPIQLSFETWQTLQPSSGSQNRAQFLANFPQQIEKLQERHTIPIYVRGQNSTLLIKKNMDHSISLSTFRPSLPSAIVMSNVSGSHHMEIPETTETIQNTDLLKSPSFAKQLYELSTENVDLSLDKKSKGGNEYTATRDVADPKLVSDWIVGLLVPQNPSKILKIQKKFRDQLSLDEIKGSAKSLPFRRSGMYMALKGTLQLKLYENLPSKDLAKLVYKLIMLRILAYSASRFSIIDVTSVDLASQMLAKLGKRVQKLVTFCKDLVNQTTAPPLQKLILTMKSNCLKQVDFTVDRLTEKMRTIWDIVSRSNKHSKISLQDHHDDKGLYHQISDLDEFISKLKPLISASSLSVNQSISSISDSDVFPRYTQVDDILSVETRSFPNSSAYVWVHDTENFIKYHCNDENISPVQLSRILYLYFAKAESHYGDNPLGKSQIYLVSVKGLEVLDKIATKECPLLLNYEPEINVSLFDHLLVPFKRDMDLLNNLLTYFRNRMDKATQPGLLSSNAINVNTFSVKYAQQNLTALRNRILSETEKAIEEKYGEVENMLKKCHQLQAKIDTLVLVVCSCTMKTETFKERYTNEWRERKVKVECQRCKSLRDTTDVLQFSRQSVCRYERPLPMEELFQWAVIFELKTPQNISIYRDYLAHVKYSLWGDTIFNGNSNSKKQIWTGYSVLYSYARENGVISQNIQLSSPTMPSSSTYHTHTTNLNVLLNKKEDFIINNGMGCRYYFAGTQKTSQVSHQSECAFKLSSTFKHGPYLNSNLQGTLESTNHTQNGILARQIKCHQKLGLEEFIAFGSLRAGHRIQMRNLYQAIYTGSISLEQEPVLALILQTIWQLGPVNSNSERESHLDFSGEDSQFAEEFVEMLDKLVKTNEANYSNSLIVLVAVTITRRIADLNGALQDKCYDLLKSWRMIMSTWIAKLETALDKPETALVHGGVASLRKNLFEIVLCSMLSYSVAGSGGISTVMKDQEDVVYYLQTLYQWGHLDNQPVPISGFFKILQNFIKTLPLRLNLESQILAGNPLMVNSLKIFISQRWNKTRECTFFQMSMPFQSKNKPSLVLIQYLETDPETGERITHQITFDFIQGRFLVNGYCQSTLPMAIKNHKLFRMYFMDATNLRIQRDNQVLTRTIVPYHNRHYEFHQISSLLIIKEIQDDCSITKLVLLDPEIFSGVLSAYFLENYTHWLDTTKYCIYFRPNIMLDDHSHHYTLQRIISNENDVWTLYDEKTDSFVLTIYSTGFKNVTKALERLELEQFINVTFQKQTLATTATLRRYNLRFTMKLGYEHHLKSIEYPGYIVCSDQHEIKTFTGLCQGLLLENGEKRLILMPHSRINYCSGFYHQNSSFQLSGNLRQPPCFVYEVDDVLKRLKAHNSKPAWLYLAALHAVTSSSFFPDQFTEVTGTEMAINILQSASVWSCSPYDQESLQTLNFIKGLSPERKWYGHNAPRNRHTEDKGTMEITKWPQGLPSMIAYDGFAIIVDKLIRESKKLEMLYEKQDIQTKSIDKLSEHLRLRGYLRSLPVYNPAAHLEYPNNFTSSQITQISENANNHFLSLRLSSNNMNISGLQTTSFAVLTKSVETLKEMALFQKNNLAKFLITKLPLDEAIPPVSLDHNTGFQELLGLDFRTNWLGLYTMAIQCKTPEDFHLFGVILSALAYRGASLKQLANLHFISLFSGDNFPVVPSYSVSSSMSSTYYLCPESNNYEISTVQKILAKNAKSFTALNRPYPPTEVSSFNHYGISEEVFKERRRKYLINKQTYETDLREYETKKAAFERQIKQSVTFNIRFWPCKNIPADTISGLLEEQNFYSVLAIREINQKLEFWYKNFVFKLFVTEVQIKLNTIWDQGDTAEMESQIQYSKPVPLENVLLAVNGEGKTPNRNDSKYLSTFVQISKETELEECAKIFQTGRLDKIDETNSFLLQRDYCKGKAQKIRENLVEMLSSRISSKIRFQTGITPRLSPITILKHLTARRNTNSDESNAILSYAGALGVLWTHLKRLNRCIRAQTPTDLQREKDNPGHKNWSPKLHPEWLLLELELDIMIRPIQVEVANQMIKMPKESNGVTQLNMGEGKTSVIVPMLCSHLAQKNSQLCRVTVLSSMFKMNLNSLTFSIGGLLNKRVYSVPCRRDMNIDDKCVKKIEQAYRQCLAKEGVILTLPEYRLSFRLLAYDKMFKREWTLGQQMLNVENFLRNYARDVLDESDELFSVKYQLVYTIGEQLPIDGGDLRWLSCQKILDIVPKIGEILFRKYGPGMVEYHEKVQKNNPHQFSPFRLLGDNKCLKEFENLLADSILSQVRISQKDQKILKRFLIEDQVNKVDHEHILNGQFSQENADILDKMLLSSGYLRRGVLGLALTKRWRVEYGVNQKTLNFSRLMAIPFRAKDVAAEKTEFGHPDLAIILTHLSYYYSGLSDSQLEEVFNILKGKQSPDSIYSQWISKIPQVPDFLERYFSLNMKDGQQKATLFNLLRKHKMVIDFWLSHCVFPRESKQFPGKLVMTAWDLCYERQRLPVTGFSGTNDSQVLLPLMITQQDLRQLENTNKNMTKTLLQPENGKGHKGFQMGVTCQQILETMKQDQLTVLIDAGALMLECSNEQVANLWLKINPNIEAAIYFNENNELIVKTREDKKNGTPFEVSPYQGRLEKCGVFLDDQHTRGTDLKFPVGIKACVTIATRMKRDKLIQACMRMRKLGQGHSVTFYLSHEARDKIIGTEISTQGVLDWVCENTRESNQDGLLHWSLAGRNTHRDWLPKITFIFQLIKIRIKR